MDDEKADAQPDAAGGLSVAQGGSSTNASRANDDGRRTRIASWRREPHQEHQRARPASSVWRNERWRMGSIPATSLRDASELCRASEDGQLTVSRKPRVDVSGSRPDILCGISGCWYGIRRSQTPRTVSVGRPFHKREPFDSRGGSFRIGDSAREGASKSESTGRLAPPAR